MGLEELTQVSARELAAAARPREQTSVSSAREPPALPSKKEVGRPHWEARGTESCCVPLDSFIPCKHHVSLSLKPRPHLSHHRFPVSTRWALGSKRSRGGRVRATVGVTF